ncbi:MULTISPECIES: hypothetical protein [unclassified Streptomyces]|uniref:hypothetical protein n=1 Tax=unclassified Streptomyces TaxID=2593676 RepID=UPI002E812521|nr:hypothetical protein [Streptomyces sp. NBC_00589]WTI40501.1 hypothetical protein OIC96_38650 [Streptomyces sp. NBC_00775]WUB25815.1 hypothetical protein OHA51_11080 [Streptomyces sp. NBC_00589]
MGEPGWCTGADRLARRARAPDVLEAGDGMTKDSSDHWAWFRVTITGVSGASAGQ